MAPDNAAMRCSASGVLLGWLLAGACAGQSLPASVDAALARVKVPRDALTVLVAPAQGDAPARIAHRIAEPMNPASVMKLVTTYAALDMLGPAYAWNTPVYLDGNVRDGTLSGDLYIVGQGDPQLVLERLWLLLRRVQGMGIRSIAGDIVLDHSAFSVAEVDTASFDGEPLRPYNAAPDALLINFTSVMMTFTPERAGGFATVQFDPPMAGVQTQDRVPLVGGECGDYRGSLRADFSDANRIRFGGRYPAGCGEKLWPAAYADPKSYATRAIAGMWTAMGGTIRGTVHSGLLPPGSAQWQPAFEVHSAPLAQIIRDINKYSNNVMAQQVFLTLGRAASAGETPTARQASASTRVEPLAPANFGAARAALQRWWRERIGTDDAPLLDNGSGLSRQERISAQALARLLQVAYRSPWMPELMASLPISGVDGTLRRVKSGSSAIAHLKTGSLSNVVALAGYVLGNSGKRYVLVAIINHANASQAHPALEALVDWTAQDD
jgi:D-alanyl-D-alanine carboxypeptidase/D-alanyl-D-alanine-endopeptidase (penicillin-binding protein 4)